MFILFVSLPLGLSDPPRDSLQQKKQSNVVFLFIHCCNTQIIVTTCPLPPSHIYTRTHARVSKFESRRLPKQNIKMKYESFGLVLWLRATAKYNCSNPIDLEVHGFCCEIKQGKGMEMIFTRWSGVEVKDRLFLARSPVRMMPSRRIWVQPLPKEGSLTQTGTVTLQRSNSIAL